MTRRGGMRLTAGALALAAVAGLSFAWAGCQMPHPRATAQQIAGISRKSLVESSHGWRISYLESRSGNGRRVLYIHGTPGEATGWADYVIEPVAEGTSVALDRPGFGESEPRGSVPSLIDQARSLEPLLGDDQPILVGHSLGGPIAAAAAIQYPDRVGAIVILAGAFDPALEKVHPAQYIGNWSMIRWLLPRAIRNSNQELIPLKGELETLRDRLGELRCPVYILHGRKDTLVPYSNVDFLRQHLPSGTLRDVVTLDDAGHFLPWEHEAEVRRLIREAESALSPLDRSAPKPVGE
ncbi:alpha/beta fold hydrolase [bacterium]|nr:alpha/beta fold hydrolase [bacterium]